MDKERKREIVAEYKQQKTTGGVYAIKNTVNGKAYIKGDYNLEGSRNRFDFAQKVNSCVLIKLNADWAKYGSGAFCFEILTETEQGAEEPQRAFRDRLKKLEEKYKAEYAPEQLY